MSNPRERVLEQRCNHRLVWIDEGSYVCNRCGTEKVRLEPFGPLYQIGEDGQLTDWTGQKVVSDAEVSDE